MNEMENLLPDPGISYSTTHCPGDCGRSLSTFM